jgi:hypothetical protein
MMGLDLGMSFLVETTPASAPSSVPGGSMKVPDMCRDLWTNCPDFCGSAIYLGMALVVAMLVFLLLWGPARKLLKMNSFLFEAKPFFIRVLFVMLLLAALSVAAGKSLAVGNGAAFMEYVWRAAGDLNAVFAWCAAVVAGYAIVLMVLVVGLGRKRD